jgi:tetratricopeptide (TPR) repeat protein
VIPALIVAMMLLASGARQDVPARLRTADRATLLNGAAAALAAGQREEAKQLLRAAADRFQSVQALLQLSRLQSGDGDAAGALESLRKARALAPNAEEVLSAFAQVSLAARMPVAAIVTLESLVRLCPAVAQYHYLLGVALMSAGDTIAAIDALKQADALDADRPLTLVALGLAFNNQKLYPEAKQALGRAVELDADNVEALAALAEAEAGLAELPAAEAHATRVLARVPAHGTANLVIGLVRMAERRYPEARDALITAATMDARSPKPEYQLSLVYARLGDQASAERHLTLYRQKLRAMEATVKALHDTGFGAVVK